LKSIADFKWKSSILVGGRGAIGGGNFPLDCSFAQKYFFIALSLSRVYTSKLKNKTFNLLEEVMRRSFLKVPI
jgi:hypothetical protein